MVQYAHGYQRPNCMDRSDVTFMSASLQSDEDSEQTFLSCRSHHLCKDDYVVMFPPGCDNHEVLPYLAKVTKVSDCPDYSSTPQEFTIRNMLAPELAAKYFSDMKLARFPDDAQLHYFHYVQKIAKTSEGPEFLGRVLPRPGFPFLRNFCFHAMHALWECARKCLYHGDVRLENFFLRNAVGMSDLLGGDDANCRSVRVLLGDFGLTAADEDRSKEFSRDRQELTVAL